MSGHSSPRRPEDGSAGFRTVTDFIDHPEFLETMTLADIRAELGKRGLSEDTNGSQALNWIQTKVQNGDPTSALVFTRDGKIVHLRMAPNGAYAINELVEYADYISEQEAIVLLTHLRFGATHLSDATRDFLRQLYKRNEVHIKLQTTRKILERLLGSSEG